MATTSTLPTTTTHAPALAQARTIEGVYRAPSLHWVGDGFRVSALFSAIPDVVRRMDPFLLFDYHPTYEYAPTRRPRGVGVHPHRGFETVTIAWQGSVAHHDSAGGGGVIGPGDVQWMTAASGILHKEYHEENYARRGGPFQMAQLWVNLPREHKMSPPRYQPLTADQMGRVSLPDGAGEVRIIAGEYQGVRGPAKTFTPIDVLDVRLNAKGRAGFTFRETHNLGIFVMQGRVTLNGRAVDSDHFVLFDNAGQSVEIEAQADAHLLVLSGEPIAEPVVQYGPFVMTSEREIQQAFVDYQRGKFGHLDD